MGEEEKLKESASRAKRVDSLSSLFYKTRFLFSSSTLSHRGFERVDALEHLFTRSSARQIRSSRDEFRADCTVPMHRVRVSTERNFPRKIRAANYEQLLLYFGPRMIYRYQLPRDPIHFLRIGGARRIRYGSRACEYYK